MYDSSHVPVPSQAPGDRDAKAAAEEERRKALVDALKRECEYEITVVTSAIR